MSMSFCVFCDRMFAIPTDMLADTHIYIYHPQAQMHTVKISEANTRLVWKVQGMRRSTFFKSVLTNLLVTEEVSVNAQWCFLCSCSLTLWCQYLVLFSLSFTPILFLKLCPITLFHIIVPLMTTAVEIWQHYSTS